MNPQKPKIKTLLTETSGKEKKLDFPPTKKGEELKKQYLGKKQEIKYSTEQKLALETVGDLQAVIFNMERFGIEKGEKSFDDSIKKLTQSNNLLKNKRISEIIKDPKLTQELLTILEKAENLTNRQKELKNYLWPLNNFYKRSAKLLGKKILGKNDFKIIKRKMQDFSVEFESSYKSWRNKEKNKKDDQNKNNTDNYNDTDNSTYETEETPLYFLDTENNIINAGDQDIELKPGEISVLEGNYIAIENFVKFHDTLAQLSLLSLWSKRNQISPALSRLKLNGLNFRDDYLNEIEQIKFINYILLAIGEQPIKAKNIKQFIGIYKQKYSTLGRFSNQTFKVGDSTISEIFLEKFSRNGIIRQTKLTMIIQENKRKFE